MKKTIEIRGENGVVPAEIQVMFNYKRYIKEQPSPLQKSLHCVRGSVCDMHVNSPDFENENAVWSHIDEVIRNLTAKLHQQVEAQKIKTIEQQLRDKGFK